VTAPVTVTVADSVRNGTSGKSAAQTGFINQKASGDGQAQAEYGEKKRQD
jgi:hypothetical protein